MTPYLFTKVRSFRKSGFTLLELLTVMCIMALMSSMAYAAYHWIARGYAIRSGVWHLSQSLALARQSAIMQGKRMFVVFDQDSTNSWYTIIGEAGKLTHVETTTLLTDEYNDLGGLTTNMPIFFLQPGTTSSWVIAEAVIASPPDFSSYGPPDIKTLMEVNYVSAGFAPNVYDSYGFEVYPRTVMPKGVQFGKTGTKATSPTAVVFNADGTTSGSKAYEIDVAEKVRASSGDPYSKIKVAAITGLVEIEYDKKW